MPKSPTTPECTIELSLRKEYESKREQFQALADCVRLICEAILKRNDVPFHSIKSRIKSLPSLLQKIVKKSYRPSLSSFTDLVGVRVICLYPLDVDRVVSLVEEEFTISEKVD